MGWYVPEKNAELKVCNNLVYPIFRILVSGLESVFKKMSTFCEKLKTKLSDLFLKSKDRQVLSIFAATVTNKIVFKILYSFS